MSFLKPIILILTLLIMYIYLKMEDRLNQNVKQRKKKKKSHFEHKVKNRTLSTNHTSNYQRPIIHYETRIKRS